MVMEVPLAVPPVWWQTAGDLSGSGGTTCPMYVVPSSGLTLPLVRLRLLMARRQLRCVIFFQLAQILRMVRHASTPLSEILVYVTDVSIPW